LPVLTTWLLSFCLSACFVCSFNSALPVWSVGSSGLVGFPE
jgi:hypothetical protein